MATGYYLLDNPNPHAGGDGFHGYRHTNTPKRVIALHTAEIDPSPGSAYSIARYFATTDRQASYQTIVDVDNTVPLIPADGVSFNIRGFNSPSVALSFATRAAWWGRLPRWDEGALRRGAKVAREWADRFDIPVRLISRSQALNGVKGFVRHSIMDPGRRGDPGDGFPVGEFLKMVNDGNVVFDEGDDVKVLSKGDSGNEVRVLQWRINQDLHGESDPEGGGLDIDGDFGPETERYVKHVQHKYAYETDGVWGVPISTRVQERLIQRGIIKPADHVLKAWFDEFTASSE